MTLTLYNTLTRKKEPFRPIDPANVRMYVCGPTVYDYAHIGNARPVIVFDVLFRLLRHLYGPEHVTYARNITDVDDKINARAAQEYPDLPLNEAIREVTTKTEKQFQADIAALGVLPPTVEPRATQHIEEMKALIAALVANGNAYVAEGHVLFDVTSMPDYGRLSNRSLEEMEAGARVDVAPYKKGPMDFVLWKPSKPGEPSWPSPSGITTPGRPGWHIECSAMAGALLGETFDIHGGGIDLVFPHHENEIAQSRCAHGTPVMANYWMHNGFLQVEAEKMSKSLGNFVTINELLQDWPGDVIRYAMLQTHYRQPIDWTRRGLENARREIEEIIHLINRHNAHTARSDVAPSEKVIAALMDDLNTPRAIFELRELAKETAAAGIDDDRTARQLFVVCMFMGILDRNTLKSHFGGVSGATTPSVLVRASPHVRKLKLAILNKNAASRALAITALKELGVDPAISNDGYVSISERSDLQGTELGEIREAIELRLQARSRRDFATADRIRDELLRKGVRVKDLPDGTSTWEPVL